MRLYIQPSPLNSEEIDDILLRYNFIKTDNSWYLNNKNIEIYQQDNRCYIKIDNWNHQSKLPNDKYRFEAKIKNILDILNTDIISRLDKTTERYIEAENFILNMKFFQKIFILRKHSDFIKNILTKYKF